VFGPSWQLYGPNDIVVLILAVTDWRDFSIEELLRVGERRLNMMWGFNAREGMDRKNDLLPKKIFKPLKGGPTDNWALDRDEITAALETYYHICGCDHTENPTHKKLNELSLSWIEGLAST